MQPDKIVAVLGLDGKTWVRGKITAIYTTSENDRVADLFLIDNGFKTENVKIAERIRALPHPYGEIKPLAIQFKLKGKILIKENRCRAKMRPWERS